MVVPIRDESTGVIAPVPDQAKRPRRPVLTAEKPPNLPTPRPDDRERDSLAMAKREPDPSLRLVAVAGRREQLRDTSANYGRRRELQVLGHHKGETGRQHQKRDEYGWAKALKHGRIEFTCHSALCGRRAETRSTSLLPRGKLRFALELPPK